MSLQSLLSAIRKDSREPIWKLAPEGADVHISTALGEKPKPKKDKPKDDEEGEAAHLPVTNMTLAAQAITGQAKQTSKHAGNMAKIEELLDPRPTTKFAEVLKVDDSLGLVLGWAIVCKKDGADYFDLQEDCIPEASMLSAAVDFMQNSRVAKEMHAGEASGTVLFAFPLTEDIAKAFGIETKTTGLMIAMKPDSDDILGKFKDGVYTGFSIGGSRLVDEEVAA